MTDPSSQKHPRRVLLLCVGNRRNRPDLGAKRPAFRVAALPALAGVDHLYLLYTDGDEDAKSYSEHLETTLRASRKGRLRCSLCAVGAGRDHDPRRRAQAEAGMREFVAKLAREIGGRFEHTEFVVSTTSGAMAQWTCLIDALDALGAQLSVVWERPDESLSLWRAPAESRRSEPMLAMLESAPGAWNVLLSGPTGSGKTEAARRLHEGWKKLLGRRGAFHELNVGALARELLSSELFGHAKGAFTGAQAGRPGAFRHAHGGTLFLDEVGELPLDLQVQLLKVLDFKSGTTQRTVVPVGSELSHDVDVRVILGTNRDLYHLAREGQFRGDLLGRINTWQVSLPPLCSVRHRIVSAYAHQLEQLVAQYPVVGKESVRFTFERRALRALLDFIFSNTTPWTWNHRDVQQSAERLAARAWSKSRTEGKPLVISITAEHFESEKTELERRWNSVGARPDRAPWDRIRDCLKPGAFEKLSAVERWELNYLLEAREATSSNAEAWRWIASRNLLEGSADPASLHNASNAFMKRWSRYSSYLAREVR